jgi:hypothetical protein
MPILAISTIEEKTDAKTLGKLTYNKETFEFSCSDTETDLINKYEKCYLDSSNIVYLDKDELKELGAKWEKSTKSYYYKRCDKDKFKKWIETGDKIYLKIPYRFQDELKKNYKIKFCGVSKNWWVSINNFNDVLEEFRI